MSKNSQTHRRNSNLQGIHKKILPPVCKVCDHFRPLKKITSGRLKYTYGEPTDSVAGADLQLGPVM